MDPGPAARYFGEGFLEKTACIYPASIGEDQRPRALMESALALLEHVSGLAGPAPRKFQNKPVLPIAPSL